jgi:hypothetical protein
MGQRTIVFLITDQQGVHERLTNSARLPNLRTFCLICGFKKNRMKAILLTLVLMSSNAILAQWTGTYNGAVNGDAVVMQLTQSGNNVNGDLKDSQQTYMISGTVNGAILTGTATESVYLVAFGFAAEKKNAVLETHHRIERRTLRSSVYS